VLHLYVSDDIRKRHAGCDAARVLATPGAGAALPHRAPRCLNGLPSGWCYPAQTLGVRSFVVAPWHAHGEPFGMGRPGIMAGLLQIGYALRDSMGAATSVRGR
jgi:hypothetical protein